MLSQKYKFILLLICILSFSYSEQSVFGQRSRPTSCPPENPNCLENGISVSDPKIFDNRSLVLMLEELERTLARINVVDQKLLIDSLGLSQGYQSRDVARSFEFGTPPIPGVTTTRKPDADGNLNISEETTTEKEISAKSPALPDLMTAPKYEPKFGTNAEDLLSQQIDLTYKIFNLRMLLERSISDRLVTNFNDGDGSRLQTILGFNIALDPPKEAKDMAAFVEITITPIDKNNRSLAGKPISVVALMPQEKTYNTSALSTKSNAFGGSAVFKILTVGYSERRRGQTFYLYQDADTITFQRMRKNPNSDNISGIAPTFGWEFRPVLGRRAVSPGMKQMFAVISLPIRDKNDLKEKNKEHKFKVSVRTYWRKYDRKTLTVYNKEVNARTFEYIDTVVPMTKKVQEDLQPKVTKADWYALDDKNVVISLEGENFFSGTNLLLGNILFDSPANGLTIKSDQSLQIRTTLSALGAGDVVLNGRYGPSIRLARASNSRVKGIMINSLSIQPLSDKTARLKIKLSNKELNDLSSTDITGQNIEPLIIIQGTAVFGKPDFQTVNCEVPGPTGKLVPRKCVLVQVEVPLNLVKEDALISFKIPLMGRDWYSAMQLYYDAPPKISKLNEDAKMTTFVITGGDLNRFDIVKLNPTVRVLSKEDKLILFGVKNDDLAKLKNILLYMSNAEPLILEIPSSTPEAPKPKIDDNLIPNVSVKSSITVKFKGEGLTAIKQAQFEGSDLQIIKKTAKEITILLTREVTKEAGQVEIVLKTDKEVLSAKVLITEPSKQSK